MTDEQPLPTVNAGRFIQDLVIEDIRDRTQVGIQRYGTALQAHNGRDTLRDAYEEAMDLTIYLRGVIEERDTTPNSAFFTTLVKYISHVAMVEGVDFLEHIYDGVGGEGEVHFTPAELDILHKAATHT